jgi:tripartite-type tricarboxylate transporter receptor subunit TctC
MTMRGLLHRVSFWLTLAGLTFFSVNMAASQDTYPDKPIRIIVPFSPGGSTDLLARGLGKHFTSVWNQPGIIENRPGGGGITALRAVLDAPRDGYTLLLHSDGFSITPAIYKELPYKPMEDFKPLALLARTANVVVVGENSPYHSLKELAAAGKTANNITYASAGVGSAQHMQAAKFATLAKLVEPVHVPFRGTPEALTEVMMNRVDFVFAPLSNAVPLLKSGKLRPLAISSARRSPLLPDVPTVAEAGFPGYDEEQWWGLFAPSGIPAEVMRKLEAETKVALKTEEMKKLIEQLSSTPGDAFDAAFTKVVEASIAANKAAAKEGKIEAQ